VPEIAADLDDVEALSRAFGVAWDRVEAAQHRFRRAAITGEALGRPDLSAAYQEAYRSAATAVEMLRQSLEALRRWAQGSAEAYVAADRAVASDAWRLMGSGDGV
jgi:hypothetical protein